MATVFFATVSRPGPSMIPISPAQRCSTTSCSGRMKDIVPIMQALGVPARFTTGFAAINRSDKNKGWYWFYASQAHAWTQVYFPGYGWLDFDMTIGNEDQQSAPRPDGTPPLPPPEPWLVLNAKTESINQKAKNWSLHLIS